MSNRFTRTFTALPGHIDELGHVNNTVWLEWVQDIAVAHWAAIASAEHQAAFIWVVTRHEIDYRGNIAAGESAVAETFVPDPPHGARFDRCVVFRNSSGREIVSARSTWALLDRASGRLLRIRDEVAAPFFRA
ncbi:acyl-CoA thioesterase [Novosphingobium tardum]|uniref:Acyl-CoA thioesterase n=1 Tax=Novosphingobium tardum TaxID=1538021 RepID=A0ABV8RLR0_9SPHN